MMNIMRTKGIKSIKSFKLCGLSREQLKSMIQPALGTRDTRGTLLHGFTMVELLLYMGILVILLGIMTGIFSSVIDVQLESEKTSSVQGDGRFLLSRLSYDIQRATSIDSPNLGSESATLVLSINSQNVTYSLDANNNLVITDQSGVNQVNSYDTYLEDITFQQIGNTAGKNTIRITYTLHSRTVDKRGEEVKTYSTTVGLR
jgi:type II secretory pathway pseudopilin PulG